MRKPVAGLLTGLAVILLTGCGGTPDWPDPDEPAVAAERDRVKEILREGTWIEGEADCRVQVLRQEGETTWAWAQCEGGEAGFAGPVRVDGDTAQVVESTGSSLRDLFPEDLADQVIGTESADYDLG